MKNEFYYDIDELQPSQLYINKSKLLEVNKWIDVSVHNYDAIPIKRYGERVVYTDGHTRALKLFLSNETRVKVYWDTDELEDDLYLECISWCQNAGIYKIEHLKNQLLDEIEYKEKWIDRCSELIET